MTLSSFTIPGLQWIWKQWQWSGTLHSPNLQHYWSLANRLFCLISTTYVGGVSLLSRDSIGVFSCTSRLGHFWYVFICSFTKKFFFFAYSVLGWRSFFFVFCFLVAIPRRHLIRSAQIRASFWVRHFETISFISVVRFCRIQCLLISLSSGANSSNIKDL